MIKTEIDNEEPQEEAIMDSAAASPNKQYLILSVVIGVCVLAVASYILASIGDTSNVPLTNTSHLGNVPALPLATSPQTPLSSHRANNNSTGQSSTNTNNMSSSSVDLQNNVPSSQGSTKTYGLQSTGSGQSTGQAINNSLPY